MSSKRSTFLGCCLEAIKISVTQIRLFINKACLSYSLQLLFSTVYSSCVYFSSIKRSMLSLLEIVNKVAPPRCPSHNAFKCTGECGFDDCNTHFMEQDALQEHIQRGREKRISLTSSCFQVFLNSDFVYLMINDYFFLISQYHHLNTIIHFVIITMLLSFVRKYIRS